MYGRETVSPSTLLAAGHDSRARMRQTRAQVTVVTSSKSLPTHPSRLRRILDVDRKIAAAMIGLLTITGVATVPGTVASEWVKGRIFRAAGQPAPPTRTFPATPATNTAAPVTTSSPTAFLFTPPPPSEPRIVAPAPARTGRAPTPPVTPAPPPTTSTPRGTPSPFGLTGVAITSSGCTPSGNNYVCAFTVTFTATTDGGGTVAWQLDATAIGADNSPEQRHATNKTTAISPGTSSASASIALVFDKAPWQGSSCNGPSSTATVTTTSPTAMTSTTSFGMLCPG
jgi:hypothetical protein